jgi:hypothetical protein
MLIAPGVEFHRGQVLGRDSSSDTTRMQISKFQIANSARRFVAISISIEADDSRSYRSESYLEKERESERSVSKRNRSYFLLSRESCSTWSESRDARRFRQRHKASPREADRSEHIIVSGSLSFVEFLRDSGSDLTRQIEA